MIIEQIIVEKNQIPLVKERFEIGFVGFVVDDRGYKSTEFIRNQTTQTYTIEYDPDSFDIDIDGSKFPFEENCQVLKGAETVLVDITTVGFVEMLYLTRLCKTNSLKISFIYIEPVYYKKVKSSINIVEGNFELSSEVNNFRSIPIFTRGDEIKDESDYVFFAGFESQRIKAAFEYKENILGKNSNIHFALPAYSPGWELSAFIHTVDIMDSKSIKGHISYSGGTDLISAYDELTRIKNSIDFTKKNLFVAPFANKPFSLVCAIFLVNNEGDDISLLYDHPKPAKLRSSEIGRLHLYKLLWDE